MKTFVKVFMFILFIFNWGDAVSRPNKEQIKSILSKIKDIPYIPELSGDSLYWVLAMEGIEIVPDLIGIIDDTTETDIYVPNIGGLYTIGDLSISVLGRIIDGIYAQPITNIIRNKEGYQIDTTESAWIGYFHFVRYNSCVYRKFNP